MDLEKNESPENVQKVDLVIDSNISTVQSKPGIPVEKDNSIETAGNVSNISTIQSKPGIPVEKDNSIETAGNVPLEVKNSSDDSPEVMEATKNEMDEEANFHYENGICIYTDPESQCQYLWDDEKQEWVPRDTLYPLSDKDYQYDGKTYTYTDLETNIKYTWNEDKKEWEVIGVVSEKSNEKSSEDRKEEDETKKKNPDEITAKDMTQGSYSFENDTHVYIDPSDGSKYFWDKEKNAWFPKVDDDFLAKYQMSYGFVDPNANDQKLEPKEELPQKKEAEKRKAPQAPDQQ